AERTLFARLGIVKHGPVHEWQQPTGRRQLDNRMTDDAVDFLVLVLFEALRLAPGDAVVVADGKSDVARHGFLGRGEPDIPGMYQPAISKRGQRARIDLVLDRVGKRLWLGPGLAAVARAGDEIRLVLAFAVYGD